MENMTLLIDPETRDLVLDEEGHFTKIFDRDTTVQNVRQGNHAGGHLSGTGRLPD